MALWWRAGRHGQGTVVALCSSLLTSKSTLEVSEVAGREKRLTKDKVCYRKALVLWLFVTTRAMH